MKGLVKKAFLIGLGAASLTKTQAEKKIKGLVKKSALSTKDGREILRKVLAEANKERKRIQQFGKAEAGRIQAKLSKVSRPKVMRLKKKIGVVGKRLKTQGRKTAKKAFKKAYRKI